MSQTVSFRLDDHYLAKLEAKRRKGESLHERARRELMEALDGGDGAQIRDDLTEVLDKMDSLKDDLALGVEWVNRNIREKRGS
jgi:hypothetical protein